MAVELVDGSSNSGSSDSVDLTVPATAQNGDLLIAATSPRSGGDGNGCEPAAGWTTNSGSGWEGGLGTHLKRHDGSMDHSFPITDFVDPISNDWVGGIVVLRNVEDPGLEFFSGGTVALGAASSHDLTDLSALRIHLRFYEAYKRSSDGFGEVPTNIIAPNNTEVGFSENTGTQWLQAFWKPFGVSSNSIINFVGASNTIVRFENNASGKDFVEAIRKRYGPGIRV